MSPLTVVDAVQGHGHNANTDDVTLAGIQPGGLKVDGRQRNFGQWRITGRGSGSIKPLQQRVLGLLGHTRKKHRPGLIARPYPTARQLAGKALLKTGHQNARPN